MFKARNKKVKTKQILAQAMLQSTDTDRTQAGNLETIGRDIGRHRRAAQAKE